MIVTKDNIRTLPIHNAKPKKNQGSSISPEELQKVQVSSFLPWLVDLNSQVECTCLDQRRTSTTKREFRES